MFQDDDHPMVFVRQTSGAFAWDDSVLTWAEIKALPLLEPRHFTAFAEKLNVALRNNNLASECEVN